MYFFSHQTENLLEVNNNDRNNLHSVVFSLLYSISHILHQHDRLFCLISILSGKNHPYHSFVFYTRHQLYSWLNLLDHDSTNVTAIENQRFATRIYLFKMLLLFLSVDLISLSMECSNAAYNFFCSLLSTNTIFIGRVNRTTFLELQCLVHLLRPLRHSSETRSSDLWWKWKRNTSRSIICYQRYVL